MPYRPGVVSRGGELLGAGISSFGEDIGNAIEEYKKEQKAEQGMADAARAFGRHSKEFQDKTGRSELDMKGMSNKDVLAEMQGFVMGQRSRGTEAQIAGQEAQTLGQNATTARTTGLQEQDKQSTMAIKDARVRELIQDYDTAIYTDYMDKNKKWDSFLPPGSKESSARRLAPFARSEFVGADAQIAHTKGLTAGNAANTRSVDYARTSNQRADADTAKYAELMGSNTAYDGFLPPGSKAAMARKMAPFARAEVTGPAFGPAEQAQYANDKERNAINADTYRLNLANYSSQLMDKWYPREPVVAQSIKDQRASAVELNKAKAEYYRKGKTDYMGQLQEQKSLDDMKPIQKQIDEDTDEIENDNDTHYGFLNLGGDRITRRLKNRALLEQMMTEHRRRFGQATGSNVRQRGPTVLDMPNLYQYQPGPDGRGTIPDLIPEEEK